MEWKWTKGEPCPRSLRRYRQNVNKKNVTFEDEIYMQEIETSAHANSFYDEKSWDALTQNMYNNGFRVSNKREDLDIKIADRHLVHQIGTNPFLANTNYLDDINVRDKFLKPINTTTEKEITDS
jgi:hypothetical protein